MREDRRHLVQDLDDAVIAIGGMKQAGLNPADVTAFEQRMKDAGKSPAMVRKIRESLSSLLSDTLEH